MAEQMIRITSGDVQFLARMEPEKAPKTCAAFLELLPYEQKLIHVRWSGESCWISLGDFDLGVPFEDVMLYRSNDVPVGDTTGWTAAAGILVDSQDNRALDSALALDIHTMSSVEYQRDAPSVGQVQVVSGIAGCGIQTQGTCRALVHRT